MDMSEIKRLLEEQGTAWHEYRKTNDQRLAAIEAGKSTAEFDAKLAKMDERMGVIDEIKAQVNSVEQSLAAARANLGADPKAEQSLRDETKSFNEYRRAANRPGALSADVSPEEYKAYKGAFLQFVRGGEATLGKDETKAMSAGVDPDGGFMLPAPMVGRIVDRVYELTPLRSMFSVVQISGNDLEGIEDLGEASSGGWVLETGSRSETNTPQIGKWRLEANEMFAQPKVTQRLLDDAAFNIEAWLAAKIANKFARVEADAFCNGDGVGKTRGLFKYTTAATADGSRAWGTMEHVASGASGAFGATKADPLLDLIAAFKPVYLNRARWLTNRQMLALVRKLKEATSDAYLWQPGLQAGVPDRLLGYEVMLSQDVPAPAAGSLSMALGDFAECYTVVERIGIRTMRDPYTEKPFIKFYSTRRVGGGVLNTEAVKFLKLS